MGNSKGVELSSYAEMILDKRYYIKDCDGKTVENWPKLCRRVADSVGKNLTGKDRDDFYEIISTLKFLPNSPCLMNAGTDLGMLSACFVLPVGDSMDEIFQSVKDAAIIHKSGGGTGFSFSDIRPKGSKVKSTQGVASGPLSFAEVFNVATNTVKQGGKRRGANMGVLRIDHPDIIEFIEAKKIEGNFSNFNFSVAVTDKFMEALNNGEYYDIVDPLSKSSVGRKSAKDVWSRIVDGAWSNGEPGILFIDTANKCNPTPSLGDFQATNPCGEQFLLPRESCNLGSLNLALMYDPKTYGVNWPELERVTKIAIKFLDAVIDVQKYPLDSIREATLLTRKVGLGFMGLHDILILCGASYNSNVGRGLASEIMRKIRWWAGDQSVDLAKKCSPYPAYVSINSDCVPYRNACLTSIQPTGTVSMIAGCSNGCEPYFEIVSEKTVMDGQVITVVNPLFVKVGKMKGWYSDELVKRIAQGESVLNCPEIPEKDQQLFLSAKEISVEDHIAMQAAIQVNGCDSSISKTINLPNSASREDISSAYRMAYGLGCKGLTVYRDGSRVVQVVSGVGSPVKSDVKGTASIGGRSVIERKKLPDVLNAKRYRVKDGENENSSFYLLICFDEEENPVEVFASFGQNESAGVDKMSTWNSLCRMISIGLRYGISVEEIIHQLEKGSSSVTSMPSKLARIFRAHMSETKNGYTEKCPECDEGKMIYEGGCGICRECGFQRCS